MFRHENLNDITDEEYENIVIPFEESIDKYIRDNIIDDFVAFYIATGYKQEALWDDNLKIMYNSAVEDLCSASNVKIHNYKKLGKILENKYGLRIINENPLELEEIKKK